MTEILREIERAYNRKRSSGTAASLLAMAVMIAFCTYVIKAEAEQTAPTPPTPPAVAGHWEYAYDGDYWIEGGKRQGVYGDPLNITDTIYGIERGREIYDPVSDAWYWLDACYDGAAAKSKEVWFPYVFQNEEPGSTQGKWCLYDPDGAMVKYFAVSYEPDYGKDNTPIPGTYKRRIRFYHAITGALIKGRVKCFDYYQLTGEDADGDGRDDGAIEIEFATDPITGRAVLDKELLDKLRQLTGNEWPIYDVDHRKTYTLADYIAKRDEPLIRDGETERNTDGD